jgi:hypothetical protein
MKVGWLMAGEAGLESKKMGYCFDVALAQSKERLYVSAGQSGLHILSTEDGVMEYISTYFDDGYYRNLKIFGERIYVADSRRGLVVLDISGEAPITTWVQNNTKAAGLHIVDNLVYLVVNGEGLQVFDITNPDIPVLISSLQTPGDSWDIWVQDGYAYVADFHAGMTVIDVSVPTEPHLVGTTLWNEDYQSAEIVRGEGDVVYIAAGSRGLIIIDVSNPRDPIVASLYRPKRIAYAEGLAVRDGIVYLALGSDFLNKSTIENGLHILDASDPYSPQVLSKARFLDWVEGVYVDGDLVYIANTWNGVRSISIQDLMQPFVVGTFSKLP